MSENAASRLWRVGAAGTWVGVTSRNRAEGDSVELHAATRQVMPRIAGFMRGSLPRRYVSSRPGARTICSRRFGRLDTILGTTMRTLVGAKVARFLAVALIASLAGCNLVHRQRDRLRKQLKAN